MEIIERHFASKRIVSTEKYKFRKYHQENNQFIKEFEVNLQKLAEICEFVGYRDEAFKHRLVCCI